MVLSGVEICVDIMYNPLAIRLESEGQTQQKKADKVKKLEDKQDLWQEQRLHGKWQVERQSHKEAEQSTRSAIACDSANSASPAEVFQMLVERRTKERRRNEAIKEAEALKCHHDDVKLHSWRYTWQRCIA